MFAIVHTWSNTIYNHIIPCYPEVQLATMLGRDAIARDLSTSWTPNDTEAPAWSFWRNQKVLQSRDCVYSRREGYILREPRPRFEIAIIIHPRDTFAAHINWWWIFARFVVLGALLNTGREVYGIGHHFQVIDFGTVQLDKVRVVVNAKSHNGLVIHAEEIRNVLLPGILRFRWYEESRALPKIIRNHGRRSDRGGTWGYARNTLPLS